MIKVALLFLVLIILPGCATDTFDIQRRQEYINYHPSISPDLKQTILNGQIHRGMSKAEVIASWGDTYQKDKLVSGFGVTENWTYGSCLYGCTILTFYNDKLDSFYKSR